MNPTWKPHRGALSHTFGASHLMLIKRGREKVGVCVCAGLCLVYANTPHTYTKFIHTNYNHGKQFHNHLIEMPLSSKNIQTMKINQPKKEFYLFGGIKGNRTILHKMCLFQEIQTCKTFQSLRTFVGKKVQKLRWTILFMKHDRRWQQLFLIKNLQLWSNNILLVYINWP